MFARLLAPVRNYFTYAEVKIEPTEFPINEEIQAAILDAVADHLKNGPEAPLANLVFEYLGNRGIREAKDAVRLAERKEETATNLANINNVVKRLYRLGCCTLWSGLLLGSAGLGTAFNFIQACPDTPTGSNFLPIPTNTTSPPCDFNNTGPGIGIGAAVVWFLCCVAVSCVACTKYTTADNQRASLDHQLQRILRAPADESVVLDISANANSVTPAAIEAPSSISVSSNSLSLIANSETIASLDDDDLKCIVVVPLEQKISANEAAWNDLLVNSMYLMMLANRGRDISPEASSAHDAVFAALQKIDRTQQPILKADQLNLVTKVLFEKFRENLEEKNSREFIKVRDYFFEKIGILVNGSNYHTNIEKLGSFLADLSDAMINVKYDLESKRKTPRQIIPASQSSSRDSVAANGSVNRNSLTRSLSEPPTDPVVLPSASLARAESKLRLAA